MKLLIFISILFTVNGSNLDYGNLYPPNKSINVVPFEKVISRLNLRFPTADTWDVLFEDSDFLNIYEHGEIYLDSATRFMESSVYPDAAKLICIYSLQRVDVKSYNRFLIVCEQLFNCGRIPEGLIMRALTPDFGKRRIVAEKYDDPSIRITLVKIRNGGHASQDLRELIDRIISGKFWRKYKELS